MGLLKPKNIDSQSILRLSLFWDKASKPQDLDVQACIFESSGLMIDACFFNRPNVAQGGMVLSGDSLDGAAQGADESITMDMSKLPPHAWSIYCFAFCHSAGTFADARNIGAVLCDVDLRDPSKTTPILENREMNDLGDATGILFLHLQRLNPKEWEANIQHQSMKGNCRDFMSALPLMQQLMRIDPQMQQQLKAMQPVFNLKKGEQHPIPLGLKQVNFGLGWEAGCDVDGSVVCLAKNGEVTDLVYYGNQIGLGGAIRHSGDNQTGDGSGDDETISLGLEAIPVSTTHCFLTINVYSRHEDFRDVKNEFVRIYNNDKSASDFGKEFLRSDALDSYGEKNGVVLGCLFRDAKNPSWWRFAAIGRGAEGRTCKDLVDECQEEQKRLV